MARTIRVASGVSETSGIAASIDSIAGSRIADTRSGQSRTCGPWTSHKACVMGHGMTIWHNGALPDPAEMTALGQGGMPGHIGIEFTGAGDNWLRARMPVDHRTHQPYGRLHGGASVALAETVASVGGACTIDRARFGTVGMEINANHIRPAKDGFVHATATAEAIGRTTQVWTIRIEDDAGKLICLSRMTLAVISLDRA
jgi:1,4-dihydroxy-2-naphthoyl-CoA hydrolase